MTLIAVTINAGTTTMIGDLLITSLGEEECDIPILMQEVGNQMPAYQKNYPVDLRQKLYIISDILALGISGNVYQLKLFMEGIKTFFNYEKISSESLKRYIYGLDLSVFTNISFIILFADKEGRNEIFSVGMHHVCFGKCIKDYSPEFGEVLAIGSGSTDFIQEAKSFHNFNEEFNLSSFDVLRRNVSLISHILVDEKFTLETIIEGWGGGFEMIYFNDEKFVKVDDITYVFYELYLNIENGEYSKAEIICINAKYHGCGLILAVSNFKNTKIYQVLPIDFNISDIDKLPDFELNFSARRICVVFLIKLSDGRIVNKSLFVDYGEDREEFVCDRENDAILNSEGQEVSLIGPINLVYDKNKHLQLILREDFLHKTLREVIEVYK